MKEENKMKHMILAMPVLRPAILVACLALAGNLNLAQGQVFQSTVPARDTEIPAHVLESVDLQGFEKIVIEGHEIHVPPEMKQALDEGKFFAITSGGNLMFVDPEMKRLIDEGKATVSFSGIDFDMDEEAKHRFEEQQRQQRLREEKQRQQEELQRLILDDVGISKEEWDQFDDITTEIEEKYDKIAEQLSDSLDMENLTPSVMADVFFDGLLRPVLEDFRTEAVQFFGEGQYTQLATRFYQAVELGGELGKGQFGMFPVEGDFERELFKLFMLPDVIDLTGEQFGELERIQRELITEMLESQFELMQEMSLLETQLSEAEAEEQAAIFERMEKVSEELEKGMEESARQLVARTKSKLDTLLTAEQKVKLAQIQADIPDYLRAALGGMKTGDADESSTASGEWRPGPNSWVPGMGAPGINPNREAPRVRETQSGRSFPGSEK